MIRRAFTRVLLSLLLLISQQMAAAHITAHWSARAIMMAQAGKPADKDGGASKALAQDLGCDQCFAFAQIASALGQEPRSFVPPCECSRARGAAVQCSRAARTVCVFHSRAPPVV